MQATLTLEFMISLFSARAKGSCVPHFISSKEVPRGRKDLDGGWSPASSRSWLLAAVVSTTARWSSEEMSGPS